MPERDRRASHLLTGMLHRKRARLGAIENDLSIGRKGVGELRSGPRCTSLGRRRLLTAAEHRSGGLLSLTSPVLAVERIKLEAVTETDLPCGRLTRARAVARRRRLTSSSVSSLEPESDDLLQPARCTPGSDRPSSVRRESPTRPRRRRPCGVDSLPSSSRALGRPPVWSCSVFAMYSDQRNSWMVYFGDHGRLACQMTTRATATGFAREF